MKKVMFILFVLVAFATVAMAQPTIGTTGYTKGQGIINMDKLGAHQNGGRGCVGCHAPHSGARGNGGSTALGATLSGNVTVGGVSYGGTWSAMSANSGDQGDETLWGQDLGAILAKAPFQTGNNANYTVDFSKINGATYERLNTGVAMCLSCHDGQVAKGAMMTNQSFEQAAGLLPSTYGSNVIPTLLGDDGGTAGNYENDHPIGPGAKMSLLGGIKGFVTVDSATAPTKLIASGTFAGSTYATFQTNYGLPVVLGARAGAGWAVDSLPDGSGNVSSDNAYVVCTTCHTPHTMFKASASGSNPIDGASAGSYPSFFFIAAPYNPAAQTNNGALASSATQFCRQCHFTGAGGANEGSNILNIKTAF